MKQKIRILSTILVIAMLVSCMPNRISAATNKEIQDKIEFSADLNERFTKSSSEKVAKNVTTRHYDVCNISLSIGPLATTGYIGGSVDLSIGDKKLNVNLKGTIDYFSAESGYVGVFDGIAFIDNKEERITIDMLYIDAINNFTAETIGCAGDVAPQILFFGEYTDSISSLSAANIKKCNDNYEKLLEGDSQATASRAISVDATTRYQSTDTKKASGYEVVTISLYHANELRNQSSMSVYGKINSHTESFEEYLVNVLGYDSPLFTLNVWPDSYMIEMIGTDKYLHSNRVVVPTTGTTSMTLTFPAYLPYIGFFTFGVPITMSSTSVEYRGVATNPVYNDNIITWNVYKRNGWTANDLDGDHEDATGAVVKAIYTYEGNVTSNISAVMGAYGAIRYEYVYTNFLGSGMTLHTWTEEALCAKSFLIVP